MGLSAPKGSPEVSDSSLSPVLKCQRTLWITFQKPGFLGATHRVPLMDHFWQWLLVCSKWTNLSPLWSAWAVTRRSRAPATDRSSKSSKSNFTAFEAFVAYFFFFYFSKSFNLLLRKCLCEFYVSQIATTYPLDYIFVRKANELN